MAEPFPKVIVLAGPNRAGKSTSAGNLLQGVLQVDEFVNADTIARGLSAFAQDRVAFQAGRIMLRRLNDLAAVHANFGFETTLSGRSYAPWLRQLQAAGYEFHLIFLWLPTADLAIARVADRVRLGGHGVPEATIRRRYASGLKNLRSIYLPLADTWKLIDNTGAGCSRVIAAGRGGGRAEVFLPRAWAAISAVEPSP